MGISQYIEVGLGSLLSGVKGHDSSLISRGKAFANVQPTINVSVPEIGPSGSKMDVKYSQRAGKDEQIPTVQWEAPTGDVAEYAVLIEDPDVPIPTLCLHHSLLYGIPATATSATAKDYEIKTNDKAKAEHTTQTGLHFVPNIENLAYIGARPPYGHGAHRYFFTVVALKKKIELGQNVSKSSFVKALDGNILAWGEWQGIFQSVWPSS